MRVREIDPLFQPSAIAVLGASERPGSLGGTVMHNLLTGGYRCPILPINPYRRSVQGVLAYATVEDLPISAEVALICTPPSTVPPLLRRLGRRGTRLSVVLTSDPDGPDARLDTPFKRALLEAAAASGMRLLGPGSTGVQVPAIGLNASWILSHALPGRLALLFQSASLMAGLTDWARNQGLGFSHVVSAGDSADIDIADLLDFFSLDAKAKAVLLYVRTIRDTRRFLSAARACARRKPVVVVKAGRSAGRGRDGSGVDLLDPDSDAVFDAAIRRAGLLRVNSIDELFEAVETLDNVRSVGGDRLAIFGNGLGQGEIAADALLDGGGALADLSATTLERMRSGLAWPSGGTNPYNLTRGGTPACFSHATRTLLAAPEVHGLLVMHTPSPASTSVYSAEAVAEAANETGAPAVRQKPVLACWMGNGSQNECRRIFGRAGIPVYETPEQAARGFLHIQRYQRSQELLVQAPVKPSGAPIRKAQAAEALSWARARGHTVLGMPETRQVLEAYGIGFAAMRKASDAEAAVWWAEEMGYPVALGPDLPAETQRRAGIRMAFNLASRAAVRAAATGLLIRFEETFPTAPTPALHILKLPHVTDTPALAAGIALDPAFGPVVTFGESRSTRHPRQALAVGLPPLNSTLARALFGRAGVPGLSEPVPSASVSDTAPAESLLPRSHAPAADAAARNRLEAVLVNLSLLAIDHPTITGVRIDPLIVTADQVLAGQAEINTIGVGERRQQPAITPYPAHLEEDRCLRDGRIVRIRPVRPEDEPAYQDFLQSLSRNDMRMRFWNVFQGLPQSHLRQFLHIDYDRDMVFVAVEPPDAETPALLGMVNLIVDQREGDGEYGVIVRSDQKGTGLGRILMEKIVAYGRETNLRGIKGLMLPDNQGMIGLCRRLGFRGRMITDAEEDDIIEMWLPLEEEEQQGHDGATRAAADD